MLSKLRLKKALASYAAAHAALDERGINTLIKILNSKYMKLPDDEIRTSWKADIRGGGPESGASYRN